MTDETSDDWSTKVNKLASRSKDLTTKGYENSKEMGKSLASKSKKVASKGLESSKVASNKLAVKSKEVAFKGMEGTRSAVQSLSKAGQDHLENRKEKKEKAKEVSESEVTPHTDSIPVTEGEFIESKVSEDYSGFTIKELKIRLKLLGLAAGGKKTALIDRLKSSRKVKSEKEESTVLDDLELKIQRIEEEYPEVLKPLPPVKEQNYSQLLKNSLYSVCGLTLMIYSVLILLPAVFGEQFGDSIFGLPFIEFFLPTWFSPEQIQPMASIYHVPFVIIGALTVFISGVLLFRKRNFGTTLLCMYFVGVLLIGRLVYFFQSDAIMISDDYSNLLHDLFLTFIVCGFAFLPRAFYPISKDEVQHSLTFSGVKSMILAEKPNSDAHLEQIIQEGLDMDFRAEVAKPKTPRARAKFEAYEKILLIFGIPTWFFAVALTISYDDGLTTWIQYSANIQSLVAVWTIGLFILIALIRFDRAARGNGWYAKEKETYVGLMDLYNKAQAKHYEYVELRAAAEAQEIIEKYPQLGNPKSGSTSKA
jgi:hypothetical protein